MSRYRLEHGYDTDFHFEDSEEFDADSDAVAVRRAKKLNRRLLKACRTGWPYYVRLSRIVVVEETEPVWSN